MSDWTPEFIEDCLYVTWHDGAGHIIRQAIRNSGRTLKASDLWPKVKPPEEFTGPIEFEVEG